MSVSFFQLLVVNVTQFLKTVKAVEDEHTRGTRAMEATVEAISQEIRVNFQLFFFFTLQILAHFLLCSNMTLSSPSIY